MWPSLAREPATFTDSLVRGSATALRRRPGYLIYDTPTRRDFWYGSYVECEAVLDPTHLPHALAVWHEVFGSAAGMVRRILSWEVPRPHDIAVPVPFTFPDDAELESASVLVVDRAEAETLPRFPLVPGEVLRLAQSQEDFARVLALDLVDVEARGAQGFTDSFVRWRLGQVIETTQALAGAWWMLEYEGELVATCGMCYRAEAARFRHVVTHPAHRGRGYARRLCAGALEAALRRSETERVVIVAEGDSTAERVYRDIGFRPRSTQFSLVWTLP